MIRPLAFAFAGLLAASTFWISRPVLAATAHNSQAGGFGASSNAGDTTVGSRRVKHSAKHRSR